jgi:hypothetical protein
MAKAKINDVKNFKPKTKKKGSAFKQRGPKDKAVSKYRGQGR